MKGTPILERLDEFAERYQGPGTLIIIRSPRKKRAPVKSAGRPNNTKKRAIVCKIDEDGFPELLCVVWGGTGSELRDAIVEHENVDLPNDTDIDTGEKEVFIPKHKPKKREITVVVSPLVNDKGEIYSYKADVSGVPEKKSGKKPYSVVNYSVEGIQKILTKDPHIKLPKDILTGEGEYRYASR